MSDPLHGTNADPSRLTWVYLHNLKVAAQRMGTDQDPDVIAHFERLARDIKRWQGEEADRDRLLDEARD